MKSQPRPRNGRNDTSVTLYADDAVFMTAPEPQCGRQHCIFCAKCRRFGNIALTQAEVQIIENLDGGIFGRIVSSTLQCLLTKRDSREAAEESISPSPSKHLEFVFYLVLPKDQRCYVIGDLEEEYRTMIFPKFGKRLADIWYAKQVASSILPIIQSRLLKLAGWAGGALGIGSAAEWFRKWSGGD